mmetsp:Transcript_10845/g.27922  ORF Transcript_10845/g.27922 Transcript_10845/m.27922 type:complete len:211 (+) Transcript_10845:512-1144(+)
MSWFMLPTNGLSPSGPGESPSGYMPDPRSSASSWLYSTLFVKAAPSFDVSLTMAPISRLACRGPAIELTAYRCAAETPRAGTTARKTSALVSWKKTPHFVLYLASHSLATPFECIKKCTSPWPCGLVRIDQSFPAAKWPSLSMIDATLSCRITVSCALSSPKYAFASRSSMVRSCVSPDVMMANGSLTSRPARTEATRWHARMVSMYKLR